MDKKIPGTIPTVANALGILSEPKAMASTIRHGQLLPAELVELLLPLLGGDHWAQTFRIRIVIFLALLRGGS